MSPLSIPSIVSTSAPLLLKNHAGFRKVLKSIKRWQINPLNVALPTEKMPM